MKRLPNGKNTSNLDRPKPILFSIRDYKIKLDILKALRARRGSISFFADASNEDRQRRKELVEEIKKRAAADEQNFVIRDGAIVSKKCDPLGGGIPSPLYR